MSIPVGFKHSREAREKMSIAHKGFKHSTVSKKKISLSHRGKKLSLETKKKLSDVNKGKIISSETKRKMSIAHLGARLSLSARKKISKARKGKYVGKKAPWFGRKHTEGWKNKRRREMLGSKNPMFGKHHTEKAKKKIRDLFSGARHPWFGKKHTEETKRKISVSRTGKASGKNNPNWRGGVTSLRNRIRGCGKYKNWQKTRLKIDDFTCRECLKRGGTLNVDHYPKSFKLIFNKNKITSLKQALACAEFWDINNGRTLCIDCHRKTKNYAGRSNRYAD